MAGKACRCEAVDEVVEVGFEVVDRTGKVAASPRRGDYDDVCAKAAAAVIFVGVSVAESIAYGTKLATSILTGTSSSVRRSGAGW